MQRTFACVLIVYRCQLRKGPEASRRTILEPAVSLLNVIVRRENIRVSRESSPRRLLPPFA
jgi:hypothetical protein